MSNDALTPDDMITLTLPDGSARRVPPGTLAREVVGTIGPRLLSAAIAVKVDDVVQDLMTPLRRNAAFRVLTQKDAESLDVLRHSGAHILATAVRRLRPDAHIGFGPAIEDGFYYDFEVDKPFTPEDLAAFEDEMRKVAAEKFPFLREEVDRAEAKRRFAEDPLKLERIEDLGADEVISTYTDGPFIDLCRGPHVPDTSYLKHFKLLNAAIISRLTIEQSRRALAEAIESGSAAQEAYQQFFGAVGHELRTPVSAILGYAEVLLDEADQSSEDPVSAAMLRDGPVIVRQCERLLTIVDSLLGAGRALSGDEQRQEVVVADAVADVVHWHRTPASTAGVELFVDVNPDATVRAHPSGVRQVLTSLVGNAIAHHHPGGGAVHLTSTRLVGESGQEMVRIIVRDDGPGLPPEQLTHVFDPFMRFSEAGVGGSGLGLPMARTIAERDGGAVRAESTVGVGSSFWLELPVHNPAG